MVNFFSFQHLQLCILIVRFSFRYKVTNVQPVAGNHISWFTEIPVRGPLFISCKPSDQVHSPDWLLHTEPPLTDLLRRWLGARSTIVEQAQYIPGARSDSGQ